MNINNTYANPDIKRKLACQTNLSVSKVTIWLINERKKLKNNKKPKHITWEIKEILSHHFNTITHWPSRQELIYLAKLTNQPEKKVAAWFATKRFECKKNNIRVQMKYKKKGMKNYNKIF